MKNKKFIMYAGIILLVLIIIGIGYIVYVNVSENSEYQKLTEYTPEEEISDENLRKTIVTLYFMEEATKKLVPEPRQIDAKELLENPYNTLVALLINGPKNENMTKIMPNETVIKSAKLEGNVVHLDFSEGFIKDKELGEQQEKMIINSIVNTLTELVEVQSVKITINGKEEAGFADGKVTFKEPFARQK